MSSSLRQTFAMLVVTAVVLTVCVASLTPDRPKRTLAVTWLDLSTALVDRHSDKDAETPIRVTSDGVERLVGTAWIEGRVTTSQGEPVVDARVSVLRDGTVEQTAPSDGAGHFAVGNVAPGEIELHVDSVTFGRAEAWHFAEADTIETWDPVIDISRRVMGRVVDLRSNEVRPAAGVNLSLEAADTYDAITTNDTGHFAWTSPGIDPIAIDVIDMPNVLASVDLDHVIPGSDALTIALIGGENARISGRVTLRGRHPLRPVTLVVRHLASGLERHIESDGYFTIAPFPAGPSAVDIEVFGKLVYQSVELDLEPGEELELGELAIEPLGELTITREESVFEQWTNLRLEGQTGRVLGHYALAPREREVTLTLAPGNYTLVASTRGRAAWRQTVHVVSEQTTDAVLDPALDE